MRKFTASILLLAIYAGLLAPLASSLRAQSILKTRTDKIKDLPGGLAFSLSEGTAGAESRVKPAPAATNPLSPDAAADLLKRLPAIKTAPDDAAEFAKRLGALPAPKTGRILPVKFPSDEGRGTPRDSSVHAGRRRAYA
ncbi:MAG: hypothetical protein ACR2IH_10805 [Pyrinomonadaceae bacterium]